MMNHVKSYEQVIALGEQYGIKWPERVSYPNEPSHEPTAEDMARRVRTTICLVLPRLRREVKGG